MTETLQVRYLVVENGAFEKRFYDAPVLRKTPDSIIVRMPDGAERNIVPNLHLDTDNLGDSWSYYSEGEKYYQGEYLKVVQQGKIIVSLYGDIFERELVDRPEIAKFTSDSSDFSMNTPLVGAKIGEADSFVYYECDRTH
jgi:hypothetical protein